MKCFVAVLGLLAVASANPGVPQLATYSYANPAGVTYRGSGFQPGFAIGPAQPVAAPLAAPVAQYAAAPALRYAQPALQYAQQPLQYAQQPLQYAQPALQYAQAPAVAVTQKVGYAHHQVPVQVQGAVDVPVTKLQVHQGVTQKLVDVAQPAVTNRRVKVRRPALRKEFYDIEHRVIVRPAGSATLELSQPISKTQKGPAVLTPTNFQQVAPVVRYGNSRQIIDGAGVSSVAQIRANIARGIESGPAPAPQQLQPQPQFAPQQPQQGPAPQLRSAEPQQQQQQQQPQPQQGPAPRLRPLQLRPEQQQPQQQQGPQPQQFAQQQQQEQQQFAQQQQQQQQQFAQQQQQQRQQFAAQQQQQQPQQQQAPQQFLRSVDANIVDAAPEGPAQQQQRPQPPQQLAPQPNPQVQARLAIPQMPVELQARLLELLSAKGGTVTEVLGENGRPADSASVLQVADALQDVNLQGGERITTRRIVVTRPIETEQEVDIQEPATKIHRHLVNTPTLFKTAVQGVQRVPVALQGVKNVATPVLQTTYAQPALQYAQPALQYAAAPAGLAYH